MKKIYVIIYFLVIGHEMLAQDIVLNDAYVVKEKTAIIDSIFAKYNTHTGTLGEFIYSAGGTYARIIIVQKVGDYKYEVFLSNNSDGDGMAKKNAFYCIDAQALNTYFEIEPNPIWGSIAIPFKIRFSPFNLTGGSTLGVYYGFSGKNLGDNAIGRVVIFAGPSFTPLNDSTDKTPQTQFGITFGGGYIVTISNNFQIGLITGEDIFNGVNSWVYKFQPWLSFSIGFNFLSNQNKDDQKALKAALTTK